MPYLGREEKHKALLTTASHDDYTEWGSIIANNSDGKIPAKWIYSEMQSPGVIWYWVNENDCSEDYKESKYKYLGYICLDETIILVVPCMLLYNILLWPSG